MKKNILTIVLLFLTILAFSQFNSTKPNDIMVAVINSPNLTAYDFASQGSLYQCNTSLYTSSEYINSKFIKKTFDLNGSFDYKRYNEVYKRASSIYSQLPYDEKDFDKKFPDEMKYSPFDVTRPKGAKTFPIK